MMFTRRQRVSAGYVGFLDRWGGVSIVERVCFRGLFL